MIFGCLVSGFVFAVWSASQHSPESIKVEAKKERTGQTEKTQNIAPPNTEKSGEQASEYWTILGRTLKITDTLLAMFTFLVIPVGIGQAYFLKRTVVHMRISERAHVSGGANIVSLDGGKVLVVTINNYGKTPAFIETMAATICKRGELSNFPGWKIKNWKAYVFRSGDQAT